MSDNFNFGEGGGFGAMWSGASLSRQAQQQERSRRRGWKGGEGGRSRGVFFSFLLLAKNGNHCRLMSQPGSLQYSWKTSLPGACPWRTRRCPGACCFDTRVDDCVTSCTRHRCYHRLVNRNVPHVPLMDILLSKDNMYASLALFSKRVNFQVHVHANDACGPAWCNIHA